MLPPETSVTATHKSLEDKQTPQADVLQVKGRKRDSEDGRAS